METRQLAYFMLACQFASHAEAAAQSGLSASALSENISALERELSLTLFDRGPRGHVPTDRARWLWQAAEPVLQRTEMAAAFHRLPADQPLQTLHVTSPLVHMLGPLTCAARLAARELRGRFPAVLATVQFADTLPVPVETDPADDPTHAARQSAAQQGSARAPVDAADPAAPREASAGQVLIDYAGPGAPPGGVHLLDDAWICITAAGRTDAPVSLETLRGLRLFVPRLAPELLRDAFAWCTAQGLAAPTITDEDMGSFPELRRETAPFALLAPGSLVAGGRIRLALGHAALPAPLVSEVRAWAGAHPAAQHYVALLAAATQAADPVLRYDPQLSAKLVRSFLTLYDQPSVTAAARSLNVAQPALSNQLRKLEELTGCALFTRHRAGLTPTDAAHRLAGLLRPALARLEAIGRMAAHHAAVSQHRLAIGFIPVVNYDGPLVTAITAALDEWLAAWPHVRLRVEEAPTRDLHRMVEAGTISLALVEAQVARTAQLDLQTRDHLGVVSSPQAGLLPPGEVSLRDLGGLPLVLPGDNFGLRHMIDAAALEGGIALVPRMEVNALTLALALVRRQNFATILPRPSVQPLVESGVLQFNPIVQPVISRRLSVLFSTERNLSPIERSLVAIFRRNLAISDFRQPADPPPG